MAKSLEEQYGERLFSALMEARGAGARVVIEPARLFPKGTSKQQVWERLVVEVQRQTADSRGGRGGVPALT